MERKEVITTLEDLKSRCPKYIKEYLSMNEGEEDEKRGSNRLAHDHESEP